MFSGSSFETVGFNSISDASKESTSSSQQTSEIVVKERGEQSNELCDKNIQCEIRREVQIAKYDETKLLEFLKRVSGPVLKEIDKVERSRAFTVRRTSIEDFSDQNVEELYELSGKPPVDNFTQTKVSCLSWSSTGNVIAVSFGSVSHEGWCTHESVVHFYNISLYKFNGKIPTNTIQTDSCITSVAMHPNEPSIVALGTHSGNVEVWSVGKDNRIDGICLTKEQYHNDLITQVSWANDSTQQLVLITSSLDGRMCVFKNISIDAIQLIDRYVLDPESSDVLKAGITCFSFCKHRPGTFVAGMENCQLLLCSTIDVNAKSSVKRVESNPVLRPLDKKQGAITFIKFSPNEDNIYLVGVLSIKISIHSLDKDAPLIDVYSDFDILGADWSPLQSEIFIAWGTSSKLCVYNRETGMKIRELAADGTVSNDSVYQKAVFNTKSTKLLAVAKADGRTVIWKVPSAFRLQ